MKRLLKVTALTGILTLVKMAMGFVIAKVVAIYTGPSGMAVLGQVQNLVNVFNGIINAPVSNGIIRYTAEHSESGFEACSPWWKAASRWSMILFASLLPFGILCAPFLSNWLFGSEDLKWIIYLTVAVLPLVALGTLLNSVINGLQNFKLYVVIGMFAVVISGSCMVLLIIYWNIHGALLAAIVQSALIGLVLLLACFRQPWLKLKYWVGKTNRQAMKDISGYIVMAIATAITMPIALVLIRNILVSNVGWSQAGQWQAVWRISEVYLSVCTMALSAYYLPRLSKIKTYDEIKTEIKNTAKIIIPIVSVMAIGIYIFRDLAITILFTEQFRNARDLFLIQLLGDVIKILSWLFAFTMLARNATKWFVATEIIFSVTFVVLSYFFVINYGIQGANIAYLVNYTLYLCFVVLNLKRISC